MYTFPLTRILLVKSGYITTLSIEDVKQATQVAELEVKLGIASSNAQLVENCYHFQLN